MPRKKVFSDFDDDGVKPDGPKRPLEFLAPTLRLMAEGASISMSKVPKKDILKIARQAEAEVEIKSDGKYLRVKLLRKPPLSFSRWSKW